MDTAELTLRQREVFEFIRHFVEQNGYPPTLQEISQKLKIQPSAVRVHLLLMQKKNALRYVPNISRGIELFHQRPAGVPIYGSAPAGHPFTSQENMVDTFELRRYISASDDLFGIYVRGDSMKDAQLATGDLLFVDPRKAPRDGEIVVAAVEGEPTIKRYYRENGTVVLRPENKKYKPIYVNPGDENFKILGVVIGMIRALDKKRIDDLTGTRRAYAKAS